MASPFPMRHHVRTIDQARAAGSGWADAEAADPNSAKGKPADRDFFWTFDEASTFVMPGIVGHYDLVFAVGTAAFNRWRELREDPEPIAWSR